MIRKIKRCLTSTILICLAGFSTMAQEFKQEEENIPVNQVDAKGKRNGTWWLSQPARMGEAATVEFGNYDHGRKYGTWYKMNKDGDLLAIETYRNDVLDGEVKYFDKGALYCIGHYRGLNMSQRYDTVVVIDPITHQERYRAIATESGSLRHGSWRYYDPLTGHLIKEEDYQVDELVYKKEFEVSAKADSTYLKKHQMSMPHNKGDKYKPPTAKQYSYISD